MSALCTRYTKLGLKTLVKIFELADILEITPSAAAELYIENQLGKKRKGAA